MACKEKHLTDWKITKRIPINKDNSKKISDSFSSDNYLKKELMELFWLKNIESFKLLRYRQVLPTKGLIPLPMPHSEENCYIYFQAFLVIAPCIINFWGLKK